MRPLQEAVAAWVADWAPAVVAAVEADREKKFLIDAKRDAGAAVAAANAVPAATDTFMSISISLIFKILNKVPKEGSIF